VTTPISGTVLGVTNTVYLWLIGKCVVDFLLVLIGLFSPALTH